MWIPELKEVKGGSIHTVWTLGNNVLSRAGVSLGETYPNPLVIAPEWSRHYGKVRINQHSLLSMGLVARKPVFGVSEKASFIRIFSYRL